MEWISVKERLPDSDGWVNVFNGHNVHHGTYRERSRFDDTKLFMDAHWLDIVNVTHWMPLPSPPKSV